MNAFGSHLLRAYFVFFVELSTITGTEEYKI